MGVSLGALISKQINRVLKCCRRRAGSLVARTMHVAVKRNTQREKIWTKMSHVFREVLFQNRFTLYNLKIFLKIIIFCIYFFKFVMLINYAVIRHFGDQNISAIIFSFVFVNVSRQQRSDCESSSLLQWLERRFSFFSAAQSGCWSLTMFQGQFK